MAPVTTTTTTSCRPPPPTPPAPIIQVTRETLSSRAGAPVLKPIFSNQVLETNSFLFGNQFIPIGDQDQDQDPVLPLDDLFVYNQGGGTPLDSDLDQGPGEEAYSPAGGARGDGGDVEGGIKFSIKMDCNWMLRGSPSGHATFKLEEAEGGAVGTS